MSKTSTQVGRAAFNLKHLRRDRCGGDTTRGDRKRLLRECMRELDQRDLMHQAAMNSNIVVADAHLNVPFVNDGNGTFRRATSVEEVLDYQDARMDGVRVQKNSFETSLFVVHLPKSMCVEVPDFYTSTVDGREVKRARLVARDYDEAKQYLEESMRWIAENFIPGGIEAVAGGDMNFDESTPHIQFQADTFSPDPKDPSKLRCRPGIAYNTDTSVRYKSGPKKGKQISGNQKFIDAQRGLREHMYSLGYPVELDVSERHDESLSPDRYAEQQDRERDLANREDQVEVKRRSAQRDVDDAATDREQAAKELEQAQQVREAAQGVLENADAQARVVAERVLKEARDKAEQEAEKIRSDAQKDADQTMGLAEAQAGELLDRAEETARANAGEITSKARSDAESIRNEALKQAERDAEGIRSKAREEAAQDAENTRNEARDEAKREREQLASERAALDSEREAFDTEKRTFAESLEARRAAAEEEAKIIIEEATESLQEISHVDQDFLRVEIDSNPEMKQRYREIVIDRTQEESAAILRRSLERIAKRRQQEQQRDHDGDKESPDGDKDSPDA
ncbi:TPA: ATP synthase F0 subunit B [Corynebacterium aurimucosum]|nr:ATP synthase F0 subunit B [Corynebacterium aurimucosum]